jgi:citrate synthase
MAQRKTLKSGIAAVEQDRITVHGLDLNRDLLGKINLGDMAFLELKKRLPTPQESVMFNAIAMAMAEYGMTPSAIVARIVYTGSPESVPPAIGAGINALGHGLAGAMEKAAKMLQQALPDPQANLDLEALAQKIVDAHAENRKIPGFGVPFHKPLDPRTTRLCEIARTNGFDGPYLKLMGLIKRQASSRFGQAFPISAPGAVGAIACELRLPWHTVRGILAVGRAVGLLGHLLEENDEPLAREIQTRAQEETTANLRQKR